MIFVVVENGTVEVLDGPAAACQYEPIDVESGAFVFYDDDGTWLRPRFIRPNRRRFFGLLVKQGAFELERNSELDPEVDPFEVAINQAVGLASNQHFASLQALQQYVASKRRE